MDPLYLFHGREKIAVIDETDVETVVSDTRFKSDNSNVVRTQNPFVDQRYQKIREYASEEDYLRLVELEKANAAIWRSFVAQGLINFEVLYENILIPELNETFDVEIGYKKTLGENAYPSDLFVHPDYADFLRNMPSELFLFLHS